jgi:hypothetical protein
VGGANTAHERDNRRIHNIKRKLEREKPFDRRRHRWEKNTETQFQEIHCQGFDWIQLAHDRTQNLSLVNTATGLRIP